jgi:SAM-dependent MidA family methyltransferase
MTPLAGKIAGEIRRRGPITFRHFMELALYHPEHGYYQRPRDPFGVEGDFYTNAQLQPVWGRLLTQQIKQWYEEMGAPPNFTVVEMGAGRAETTAEIQRCLPAARCIAVDLSSGELPEKFSGVVICNEFFDALPVHSVERHGESLVEHYVGLAPESPGSSQTGPKGFDNQNRSRARQQAVSASTRRTESGQSSPFGIGKPVPGGSGFEWAEGEPSDPKLQDYIKRFAPGLAEGQKTEANLAALDALERIASTLEAGYILTIDYGYTAEEIAAARRFPEGSLMAYQKHQATEDILTDPGNRDLTAHVNFTALVERGEELGLTASPLVTQMRFLMELGEKDNFNAVLGESRAASEAPGDAGNEPEDSPKHRMQLKTLLFGMGETFQVLVQTKRGSSG